MGKFPGLLGWTPGSVRYPFSKKYVEDGWKRTLIIIRMETRNFDLFIFPLRHLLDNYIKYAKQKYSKVWNSII